MRNNSRSRVLYGLLNSYFVLVLSESKGALWLRLSLLLAARLRLEARCRGLVISDKMSCDMESCLRWAHLGLSHI